MANTPEPITDTDGEVVSKICPETASPHVWVDVDYIYCELCGSHLGVVCHGCSTHIDLTFNADPRETEE